MQRQSVVLRWILSIFIVSLLTACLTACRTAEEDTQKQHIGGHILVYTTVYPMGDFVRKIGGSHVKVRSIVPPGVDPHDFELTPKDVIRLSKADIVVYNGAGFEHWVDKVKKNESYRRISWVDASSDLPLLHVNQNGTKVPDPHVWLDPVLARGQAKNICDALVKVDASHKEEYEKNYGELVKRLDRLHRAYVDMVKKAERKEFVVSHSAFHYLAERYGLLQVPISGLSHSDEPSAKQLHQLFETMKKHQVRYIFFESMVNNKIAQIIQREIKVQPLVLHPLETLTKEERDRGADYFSIMDQNRENLARVLYNGK